MKRRLTSRAYRDIENILTYIQEQNPRAAEVIAERIEHTLDLICEMPLIGRPSGRPGARERPVRHAPLLVVYQLTGDTIEVLSVFHTSRNPNQK